MLLLSLFSHVQLCDPMDCSLPGFSVHGILQARTLEWVPFPSPGDLFNPGIELASPALADGFFTTEPLGKPFRDTLGKFQKSRNASLHLAS